MATPGKMSVEKGRKFEDWCEDHIRDEVFPNEDYFRIKRQHHPGGNLERVDFHVQLKKKPGNQGLVIECKNYGKSSLELRKAIRQVKEYKKATGAKWAMIWISNESVPSPEFLKDASDAGIEVHQIDMSFIQKVPILRNFRKKHRILNRNKEDATYIDRMHRELAEYLAEENQSSIAEALNEMEMEVERDYRAFLELVDIPDEMGVTEDSGDFLSSPHMQPERATMQKIDLIKPEEIIVDKETLTATYGRFTGEPFERGFGLTLGNALRRVLLSSLTGAAITKVHINGVLHEFSTVSGMTEDVTDLLLNLKEIRFRLEDTDQETIRLDVQGQGEVTAADLKTGAQVEILNPDKHLASLGKDASLEFEAVVQTGRGYVTTEQHKSEDDPLGTIPLDAAFSPVRRVNITVTNARVGQRTDYERLALEVWTDGSLRPEKAVAEAARIIQDQLSVFVGPSEEQEWRAETREEPAGVVNENLLRPIEELNLSVRSANCLQSADLRYVGELVQRTEPELLKTKNFGRKSLNEIEDTLQNMGLELGLQLGDFPSREELDRRRAEYEPELSS